MDETRAVVPTILPPIKIATGNFLYPQWSSDSITLTYKNRIDPITYGYNTIDSSILEAKEIECIGIYVTDYCKKTVDRDIYSIPPDVYDLHIFASPSEELAIFMVFIPDPHPPTPEPYDEAYPNPVNEGPRNDFYDVWVAHRDSLPMKIGTIPACGYKEMIWSPDELMAVLPRDVDIRRCGDYSGWVIDLSQKHLIPVIPYNAYGTEAHIYNMSPNGKYISTVVSTPNQHNLLIVDLTTLVVEQLNIPNFVASLSWISENHILISYKDSSDSFSPGILDLSSNRIIPLASSIANPKYCERRYFVSPDKNWLAFTVTTGCPRYLGQSGERITTLWLIDLSGFK